jgi:D-serine deaminase-like pyridoxal phosphate-dependent protein
MTAPRREAAPLRVSELDTPAIVVDLDIMERNLARLADYARGHGLRWRPHTKTHKIPALARRQLDLGAAGLTVAKVGEAEVMLDANPADLLVAYPIVGDSKLSRLMQVARRANLTVSLDSLSAAQPLSDAACAAGIRIGALAEVDVGLGRVGVEPADVLALAQNIARLPGLRFEGIAFYPGHVKLMDEEGLRSLEAVGEALGPVLGDLRNAGLDPRIVSGGSTPTMFHSHRVEGLNEIRPGTYIFNDRNTVLRGACGWEDCAASILTTVVSTAKAGQIIIDGGSKTFSSDCPVTGGDPTFGRVVEAPEARFTKMNEEHGFVDIRAAGRTFAVGDRLRVIPNHICVAMNLHERAHGVRGDRVEHTWRVDGRGKLQ